MINEYFNNDIINTKGATYNKKTLNQYKKTLLKHTLTKLNYTDKNLCNLFNDIKKMEECITSLNLSTKKQAGIALQIIYSKFYNKEMAIIAKTFTDGTIAQELVENQNKKVYKPISEANEQLEKLALDYQILKEQYDNEDNINTNKNIDYNEDYQRMIILYIIRYIGVLRPNEFYNMRVIGYREGRGYSCNKRNYINLSTGEMIINEHKNSIYDKNKICTNQQIIKLSEEFCDMLQKLGVDCLVINENRKLIIKSNMCNHLKKLLKINIPYYELRHMKTSQYINMHKQKDNMKSIEELGHNQGHTITTQLEYYTTYI